MTSDAPTPPQPRTSMATVALIAGLIAFLAGLAVMAALFRFGGWWADAPATAPAAPQAVTGAPAAPATTPGVDLPTLAAREQALAARLDALDTRLQATDADARAAAGNAGRAEAMMLVFAARRALDRGQPLGFAERELRVRFQASEPQATAIVLRAAAEPVTMEDLRFALDQIAPRLSTGEPGEDWWAAIRRELATLVIVRKDSAPSPHPRERLTRARRLLGQGHVEAALAEVARLPGAQGAESWMAAAGRYIEVRDALATLEAAAIQGKAQPAVFTSMPAAPAAPPAPIAPQPTTE